MLPWAVAAVTHAHKIKVHNGFLARKKFLPVQNLYSVWRFFKLYRDIFVNVRVWEKKNFLKNHPLKGSLGDRKHSIYCSKGPFSHHRSLMLAMWKASICLLQTSTTASGFHSAALNTHFNKRTLLTIIRDYWSQGRSTVVLKTSSKAPHKQLLLVP